MVELKSAILDVNASDCKCDGSDGWTAPVSEFNSHLVRYKLGSNHGPCNGCSLGTGVLQDGIHILVSLLPPVVANAVMDHVTTLKTLTGHMCQCHLRSILKKQTGIIKLGGKYITEYWRDFSYWEMLWGYCDYKGPEKMAEDTQEWLVRPLHLGGPLGPHAFNTMMAEEMARLMREEWTCPPDCLPPDEWVATGRWMRGQAGTGRTTTVKIDDKTKRTPRMKGVDAAFMSDQDMVRDLFTVSPERFVVMEKSEGVKVRPVVKTGTEMFRKMDYLGQWVEVGFNKSKLSSLFGGSAGQDAVDEEIMSVVARRDLWKVPMDQGNFDWHQSKASIAVLMAVLGLWIESIDGIDPAFPKVWAAMWDSLFASDVSVELGSYRWTWENGLPSGFRWTALLDTLLNICSFRVAVRCAESIVGHQITVKGHKSQGDDVTFACPSLEDIGAIIHVYNRLGYEVHPSKTYYSRYRTEFLRKSFEHPLGIVGYAGRTLLSIRFRNPILEMPVLKPMRLYSRLTLWHLLSVRGADGAACARAYLEDALQMGVSETNARGFALCPASFGGAGLSPSSALASTLREGHPTVWRTFEVDYNTKRIRPLLGKWNDRIQQHAAFLDERQVSGFSQVLARSWGIREADIHGKVDLIWKDVLARPERPACVWSEVPVPDRLWQVDHIPVLLRPFVKQGAIDNEEWRQLIRPEWVDWVERLRGRISSTVFRAYMLGHITISWPIVDGVATRYGLDIRKKYDRILRGILWTKDLSMDRLARYCAWLEMRIGEELQELAASMLWGV